MLRYKNLPEAGILWDEFKFTESSELNILIFCINSENVGGAESAGAKTGDC